MDFYFDEQAIVACSTSLSTPSAIALIRLSGFKSLLDLQPFFSFNLQKVVSRKSHLSLLVHHGSTLDEVLLVFFPAPFSYTGENVLEISVHGNPLSVHLILEAFCSQKNIRLAREGEFTYRALKNKKLNLSQVEGLDLILNAQSAQAFAQGLSLMHGELHNEYFKLHDEFLKLKASIELSIDFLEDVGEENADYYFRTHLFQFQTLLNSLHARTQGSSSDLLSPSVVLVGQTNAGKSSLFNAMLKNKRSIVSPIAGTTRDFVSEYLFINRVNFKLVDTAGLRITQDPIEQEGIDRALDLFKNAFFRILVINPFETNEFDFEPLFTHFKKEDLDLIILSHSDFPDFEVFSSRVLNHFPCEIPRMNFSFGSIGPTGSIEPVLALAAAKFDYVYKTSPILVERHREIINKIHLLVSDFVSLTKSTNDIGIIASQINIISSSLEELIGIVSSNLILDSIFSRFCIGK